MFCNVPARFPNGVIFCPAGDSLWDSCFSIINGTWSDGSANTIPWTQSVYGGIQLTGKSDNEEIIANSSSGILTQNSGSISYMASCDDSAVHSIGEGWTENPAQTLYETWKGAVLNTGKYDASSRSFVYSQTLFRPHLVGMYKGALSSSAYDSLVFPDGPPGTAWSQDGTTGYVVIFGNLDSAGYDYASYQPIVYKTSNSGATWAMMPLFNFRNLPVLTQYLAADFDYTQDSGFVLPIWDNFAEKGAGSESDYDLVVDANYNLHILGAVEGMAWANPDSTDLIWTYNSPHYFIYDVYSTLPSGGWQARFIDSLLAEPDFTPLSNGTWTSNTNNDIYMGARIQASRTMDGSKVFVTWSDDFQNNQYLTQPDVLSQGYDVVANTATSVSRFTNSGYFYFLCVSNIVMETGTVNKTYTIPCTFVEPQVKGNNGLNPVNYFYLDSVQFTDGIFYGVNNIHPPGFSVSANYPNPFASITRFNINLEKESHVSVDVYTILGEEVWSEAAKKMSMGSHLMTINGSGLRPGIYFYKVTVDGESITRKMIVE
jgi:hypothetical protein